MPYPRKHAGAATSHTGVLRSVTRRLRQIRNAACRSPRLSDFYSAAEPLHANCSRAGGTLLAPRVCWLAPGVLLGYGIQEFFFRRANRALPKAGMSA